MYSISCENSEVSFTRSSWCWFDWHYGRASRTWSRCRFCKVQYIYLKSFDQWHLSLHVYKTIPWALLLQNVFYSKTLNQCQVLQWSLLTTCAVLSRFVLFSFWFVFGFGFACSFLSCSGALQKSQGSLYSFPINSQVQRVCALYILVDFLYDHPQNQQRKMLSCFAPRCRRQILA